MKEGLHYPLSPKEGLGLLISVFFLGLLLTAIPSHLFAQPQLLRFERLTIEDGLPNPSVLDIAQDKKGFIWLATPTAIVRYDGYEMKDYYPSDGSGTGYRQRDFPHLYVDKSGGLWLSLAKQ